MKHLYAFITLIVSTSLFASDPTPKITNTADDFGVLIHSDSSQLPPTQPKTDIRRSATVRSVTDADFLHQD